MIYSEKPKPKKWTKQTEEEEEEKQLENKTIISNWKMGITNKEKHLFLIHHQHHLLCLTGKPTTENEKNQHLRKIPKNIHFKTTYTHRKKSW